MIISRAVGFINTHDALLIELYREFSEDKYCAGWMGDAEEYVDEFKEWLIDRLLYGEGEGVESYEREGLPALRVAFEEAKMEFKEQYVRWKSFVDID